MFKRILIVCVGNICRSPTAECLLKHHLADKGYTIASAGIHALVGKAMDDTAHNMLAQENLSFTEHTAQQLNAQLIAQFDIILVMEKGHLEAVYSVNPAARGRTFLLGKWLNNQEIPDPYRHSQTQYQLVFDLIKQACNAWLKHLN